MSRKVSRGECSKDHLFRIRGRSLGTYHFISGSYEFDLLSEEFTQPKTYFGRCT